MTTTSGTEDLPTSAPLEDDQSREALVTRGAATDGRGQLEVLATVLAPEEVLQNLSKSAVANRLRWEQDGTSFSTDQVYVQTNDSGAVIRLYHVSNAKPIPLTPSELAEVELRD